MTQKDKVKELVGRGLDSYHTKSLQQMDRIEKKNKEQNHKISILSNELDNDYLTKTEEGSVVSLEHSKEGMIYLDELQGNTLVNYCTDGSKELTLNGDIDLEGTFVTTTEGVDNGKVDVMCEGSTLVNLCPLPYVNGNYNSNPIVTNETITITLEDNYKFRNSNLKQKLIKGKTYTVIGKILENNMNVSTIGFAPINQNGTGGNGATVYFKPNQTGIFEIQITPTIEDSDVLRFLKSNTTEGIDETRKIVIENKLVVLEGDYTGQGLQYFEGMKSVGQDDENGHKIEILSQSKNLFDKTKLFDSSYAFGIPTHTRNELTNVSISGNRYTTVATGSFNKGCGGCIKVEKNKDYTLSIENVDVSWTGTDSSCEIILLPLYKNEVPNKSGSTDSPLLKRMKTITSKTTEKMSLTINSGDYDYIQFYIGGSWKSNPTGTLTISYENPQLECSSSYTNYTEHSLNKKEILLNEPLRSLPNGVKDRFVKIGGKLFIERNCGEMYINVPSSGVSIDNIQEDRCRIIMADYPSNILPNQNRNTVNLVCDKIPYVKQYDIDGTNPNYSYGITTRIDSAKGIYMWVTIDKMPNQTLDGFKEFINNTQPKIIYQLETPIYEPLEIEPTLSCYSEVTHFSNNSIIPCNMKIKNSGYNAIIKPSTLYTVALDTNKSGTIGMNLGGVKGTTTNNVLKLTTPATLTDDSLRLYGKGIKGSKVRLLEGDKTNWIPSHFEGMKSSFEDKLQDDGTYKMEILSNNKNLLKLDDIVMKGIGAGCTLDACSTDLIQYTSNQAEWTQIFFMMKLKPFTRYTLSAELQSMNVYVFNDRVGTWDANKYIGAMQNTTNTLQKKQVSFTTNKTGCISIRFTNEIMLGVNIAKNIMLSEVVGDYTSKKSNKIQFSSIEPLRGIENIKDKFVFKDGKLMIQRNLGEVVLDGNHNCSYAMYDLIMNHYNVYFRMTNVVTNKKTGGLVDNDKLPTYKTILYSEDVCGFGTNDKWFENGFSLRLPRIIVGNGTDTEILNKCKQWLAQNPIKAIYQLEEPTYEEIPFELQKIILEGYENGTLFFDTNIPPTSTITYAGETPIVKSVKLNKTEVLNNTNDINDNIIPYLMDMDYRVVCLQLQSEEFNGGVSMARLFGGAYEMLQRDIQSKRYSVDEYRHRLDVYLSANKITEDEYNKLGDMLNE